MRSPGGTFPQYHTSADNLEFVRADSLARSLQVCIRIMNVLEQNRYYCNQNPYCEPQLGKRGLYPSMGGTSIGADVNALLWVLNLSDGANSLLDIAERSRLPFPLISQAADFLANGHLLRENVARLSSA